MSAKTRSPGAVVKTVSWGAASLALYVLLFLYADDLTALAAAARQGEWSYALVPIGVAIVFSLVHGAFTGQFWDLLGLKAKQK